MTARLTGLVFCLFLSLLNGIYAQTTNNNEPVITSIEMTIGY